MPAQELLYGRNAVRETLRAGRRRVHRLLVARGAHGLESILDPASTARVRVEHLERAQLDRLLGHDRHQGVLADAEAFPYSSLPELLATAQTESPLILVLDSLQDPQNLGSLIRTAQACGVHGVVIPEHRAVGVTAAVSNASAGAVEHLCIVRATNLVRALQALKSHGVWIYGLTVGAPEPYWRTDWTGAAALVVGSEGSGLGRLVRETCDLQIAIPMAPGAVQSLNASVAGSIVLYEAFRQRS